MNATRHVDSRDFTIGLLTVTAVVLFSALVLLGTRPAPAVADGMTTSGGDYVVTVGGVGVTDEEYVYVLDVPMERLIAYRFDTSKKQIAIAHGVDLSEIRSAATRSDQRDKPRAPTQRGRGRRRP